MTSLVFLIMSLIGGVNAVLVKLSVGQFSPVLLVLFRSVIAAFILAPFIPIVGKKSLIKLRFSKNLIIAHFLFAGNWLFFAIGIQYTSVIMASIIYALTALIVGILGYVFLREKLSKEQIIGLILTLVGMAILSFGSLRTPDVLSFGTPLGNLIVIAGLLSWSSYVVVTRKISQSLSLLEITFFNFVLTSIIALMLLSLEIFTKRTVILNITVAGVLSLAALALFSSVIFFYLYQWLIKHTSAFISSLVLYPTTILGLIAGVIFFGEKLSYSLIAGGVIVILGVFIATSYKYINIKEFVNQ